MISLHCLVKLAITSRKTTLQKYKGWSLADDEFGAIAPHKARIMFYIMVSGQKELANLDTIMTSLYHVDHFFLLHMDVKVCYYHCREACDVLAEERGRRHTGRQQGGRWGVVIHWIFC